MLEDLVRDNICDIDVKDAKVIALLKKDAEEGLRDLYHFDKYILGYKEMELKPHKDLCDFIRGGKKKKLIMMPRGSFKSSCVTIGYSLHSVVLNPDVRILIASEKLSNAQAFLSEIKGHIERNDYFRLLFGKLDDKKDEGSWNTTQITVSTREKNLKEPTISTAGIDVTKVGMHYDKIIVDDPVSKSNVTSSEQIEKVFEWYRLLLSLLEPGGELIIIGCLTADSLVLMADGTWRNINKVKVGEYVFSYKDKKIVTKKVEAVIPQGKAKVYKVKTKRHEIKATDRHPFLTADGNWKRVKDLKVGDKVITLSQAPIETSKRFYDNRFLRKDDFFLLGYLLGDGWLLQDKNRGVRGFCIAKGVNDKFIPNLEKWTTKYQEKKEGYYRIDNKKIGDWLHKNGFRSGAKTKRIPEWVFKTRTCYRRAFIDGLLEADGCRVKGDGRRIELANKGLIEDLYWLSLTSGYRPTTITHRERFIQAPNSKEATMHDFYSIGLTSNFRQSIGENQFNWRWDRIESITESEEEEVFDLTVEDTANFISNGYVVHNTRWSFADLYGTLQEKPHSEMFDIYIKQAEYTNADGEIEYLFPTRLTKEFLDEQKKIQGTYVYNCQYQNFPISSEDATFKPEWFRYYIDNDLKGKDLNKFMCVDPAISLSESADFTVFIIVGIDQNNNMYILHIDRGKYMPNEIVDKFIKLSRQYDTLANGLETIAFQKTLKYQLNDKMRETNHFVDVTELKDNRRVSKELRIRGLQPRYEQGTVYHLRNSIETKLLEDELMMFPLSKHDDIADALASCLEIIYPPTGRKVKHRKKKKGKNYICKRTGW